MDKTGIFSAVKKSVRQYSEGCETVDDVAKSIASEISKAVVETVEDSDSAKYLLDQISYHTQSWCNPALGK